jgi:ABC-type antimicrobial peptide transport system permease subunit
MGSCFNRFRTRTRLLRQGAILAALGGIIGITCSLLLGRLLRGLLYGIASTDPFSFAFTSVVLFIVALTASFIPARRASKVDPMTALRHD